MRKEILNLMELDVYDLVKITPQMKIISGVWTLQQKQDSDGLLKHLQAQCCAQGFKQVEGIDYFKTYSHVVIM